MRQQAVTERAVAHPANLHANENLWHVSERQLRRTHQPHHEFVVRRRTKIGPEVSDLIIHLSPEVQGRMWRHPSFPKRFPAIFPRAPISVLRKARFTGLHVEQIAVDPVYFRIRERFRHAGKDIFAGEEVVGVQKPDHVASCHHQTRIQCIVEAFVGSR